MKKIICLIVCLLFSVITLCACNSTYENSFIRHNYQRDYNRVIVSIDPVEEPIGVDENGKELTFTTSGSKIYKSQLVNYINTYGSVYVNSYGMEFDAMVDYLLEQLILTELVMTEADVRFASKDIFWTQEDIDTIERSVYDSLDSLLNDIANDLLDKSGLSGLIEPDASTDSTETTYPVRKEEEPETKRVFDETCRYGNEIEPDNKKHDDWYMNTSWYIEKEEHKQALPGNYGNADTKSLARESVKRLITQLYKNTENVLGLTDKDKSDMAQEVEDLNNIIKTKGVAYAYSQLGKTLMVKKLIGDSLIMSQKMTILQDFIENGVSVSEEEILAKYNKMLLDQKTSYAASSSSYDSAATGTGLVLYRPNNNYVYVKHILLPFSDEQKEYLTEYKEHSTEEEYLEERDRLVNNIVAYEHVDGEDDTSRPLSVDRIWSEVKRVMKQASANPYDAERAFDDLIFKYNTDPGIFNNEYGYAVKYKLGDGESETYMSEFAETARAFRDEGYKVGQIYNEYILTDYGVHIMYYAADYEGGDILSLNSYTTAGRYTLVKDAIRDELRTSAQNSAYTKWQNERIYYYRNTKNIVNLHEKIYKDLYSK